MLIQDNIPDGVPEMELSRYLRRAWRPVTGNIACESLRHARPPVKGCIRNPVMLSPGQRRPLHANPR